MQRIPKAFGINALQQVVDQSPLSILIADTKGDVVYVNPAFTVNSGYTRDEIIGVNPRLLQSGIHKKEFYKDLWDTISRGEAWKGEILNKKKDGSVYWGAVVISPVFNENKEIAYYSATHEDISEKKSTHQDLLRSEMQFRNLAETAPITIAKIDVYGNLLYFNNYFKRKDLTRYHNIFELLTTKNEEELRNKIEEVFRTGGIESIQLECQLEEGVIETFLVKICPNKINGTVDTAILIAQDISELLEVRTLFKRSQNNSRLLAENVADVVWIINKERAISFISPSIENVLGYTPAEFLSLNLDECLPDESVSFFLSNFDQLKQMLDPNYVKVWEANFKKKNGDVICVETRIRVILDDSNEFGGIIGVTRDITGRKASEQAILKSEIKFRSFFENSNAIILVIDTKERKIVDANRAAIRYYGYSVAEFIDLKIDKEFSGLINVAKLKAADLSSENRNIYVQRHRIKNGGFRDVEILPARVEVENKILVYVIIQDVTQRKRAVEALKESESKKLALLKIIPDLIFVLNKEGEFIDIYTDNPKRLSVPPYRLLGKKCNSIFPEGLCVELENKIIKAISSREIQSFEYRYKRNDGHYVVEEIRIIVSGVDEVLAIVRDVTSQKNIEIELKKAWQEAKEAERVKGVFLANISHEIRTPINAILGFGELLESELENPGHIRFVQTIRTSSKSLLNLINDLLDLSKIESGKMSIVHQELDLGGLLSEIENIFSIKIIEKNLDFKIDIDDHCPLNLLSDEMRIRQILINLISNAIKFTHKGHIHITIEALNRHVVEYTEYVNLNIIVEDTGIGIAHSNLKQIFEAFKQQEEQDARKYGGTGLGLTITKRLVELLEGTIKVNSKLGEGSRFTVSLKDVEVAKSNTIALADSESVFKIGQIAFEPAKVLIVDDEQENREIIKGVFKGSDIAFIEATNRDQAIELIKVHKPRLSLISVKMPKKEGLEVAQFIKSRNSFKHIPVIGVSVTIISYEVDPRSIFLDEFISLPIDTAELLQKISCYLPVLQHPRRSRKLLFSSQRKIDRVRLVEIKKVLDEELAPVFSEISKTSSFKDYDKFARLLIENSVKFDLKKLSYIGNSILEATKRFDLENINKLFSEYKELVVDLSAIENTDDG